MQMLKYLLLVSCLLLFLFQCAEPAQNVENAELSIPQDTVVAEPEPVVPIDTAYLMGKYKPAQRADFVKIEKRYAVRENMYMRKEAYDAFLEMYEAAKQDGIQLNIRSAARTFYHQKNIWEAKWTGARRLENGTLAPKSYPIAKDRALQILEYSSMPGTSRHHWGTDIDLNMLNNAYFESGKGKSIYQWMNNHAHEYGFCQVYSAKGDERPYGYNEERWHWSYLPIADELTKSCQAVLKDEMINGFKGASTAAEIDIVKRYVLGLSPACQH